VQNFALAERTDEGLRLLVRGRYRAEAGDHTVEGRGLWTDRIVQADSFTLIDPDAAASSVRLPLPGGVALAGRLSSAGAPTSSSTHSAPSAPSGASPSAAPHGLVAAEDPSAEDDSAAAAAAPEPHSVAQTPPDQPNEAQPSDWSPRSDPADPPQVEAGGTGHTLPTPFTSPITDLPSPPPVSPPSVAAVEQPTFIESLPWSTGEVPSSAQVTQPVPRQNPAPGDLPADRTVSRDSLPREGVQTVVAARCPSGHWSPAYAGNCRVCGQALPPQQPVEIPRPPLGALRLSNGDTVTLDRGCILGRNPRLPTPHAGEQPNLVKLVDPDKDISGQHLEVRLEYWHVAVKDLGSTNGTQVVLPGENPVTLRPNDPMMIEPGTKVILAGVFSFTFEVTP